MLKAYKTLCKPVLTKVTRQVSSTATALEKNLIENIESIYNHPSPVANNALKLHESQVRSETDTFSFNGDRITPPFNPNTSWPFFDLKAQSTYHNSHLSTWNKLSEKEFRNRFGDEAADKRINFIKAHAPSNLYDTYLDDDASIAYLKRFPLNGC